MTMTAIPRAIVIMFSPALIAGLLHGCASAPSPQVKLAEARATLERARSVESPDARADIEKAQGVLEYAESEYRLSPDHPLSGVRAQNALEKARVALQASTTSHRGRFTAH